LLAGRLMWMDDPRVMTSISLGLTPYTEYICHLWPARKTLREANHVFAHYRSHSSAEMGLKDRRYLYSAPSRIYLYQPPCKVQILVTQSIFRL
jgi:hypothetical protein